MESVLAEINAAQQRNAQKLALDKDRLNNQAPKFQPKIITAQTIAPEGYLSDVVLASKNFESNKIRL